MSDNIFGRLVTTLFQRLPLKDFSAEVRASLDIEMFIKEATLLLDIDGTNLDAIIDKMLDAVFFNRQTTNNIISQENIEANHWSSKFSSLKLSPGTSPTTNPNQNSTMNQNNAQQVIENNAISMSNNNLHSQTMHNQAQHQNTLTGSSIFVSGIGHEKQSSLSSDQLIAEAKKALFLQVKNNQHNYQRLAKTIKGISLLENEGLSTDQSWMCAMCSMPHVNRRYLALARLSNPVNLGRSSEGTYFIILKGTKTEIELGRTFATILSDLEFRQSLLYAIDEAEVKSLLWARAHELAQTQAHSRKKSIKMEEDSSFPICNGIISDFRKRFSFYPSDIFDGIKGNKTIRKCLSATVFLFFACLLPSIAFGVLNSLNTDSKIDVRRIIISQIFGGLFFGFFGGQPLIILLTTAPLAIYTKILFTISKTYDIDFFAFYGCVGMINSILLILYAALDLSRFMRWSTRSTEEIFALFAALAFLVDAYKDLHEEFKENYYCPEGSSQNHNLSSPSGSSTSLFNNASLHRVLKMATMTAFSNTSTIHKEAGPLCQKDVAILYLLLILGTVWMGVYLLNFTKTPFLTAAKREMMTDFALPLAVLSMSFLGAFVFSDIKMKRFEIDKVPFKFELAKFELLSPSQILIAFGFAIPLSLLFFMEQNITSAMVNSPANKLKKGAAYHWDLMVVGVINLTLSLFSLPWVYGALPHSPLHVKALADMEERIDMGHHVQQTIVRVRETRLTSIIAHFGIALSILMLPYPLLYIPRPVLNGLFVYMAVTAVNDNQLFERIMLFFTEQAAYPPSHYIRRVPQRKLHLFTLLQLIQLASLCLVGFVDQPFVNMCFPIILMLQIFIRQKIVPRFLDEKYLDALDRPI